jgi:phosphomannomutase/phosphoglucomutase
MEINPHIFREFSIRGIADSDLTDDVVIRIGQAIGTFFVQRSGQTLVIGRDIRLSSDRLGQALAIGIQQTGLDIIDIGHVPTPVLNFSTDFYQADGGIMITASHNPPDHNGLKVRAAQTLTGAELQQIYQLASSGKTVSNGPGHVRLIDPLPTYLDHLKPHARQVHYPLSIVVDGGNGTNGQIVSGLLKDLGCAVTELYCEPDGRFPNRKPDPTASGALDDLASTVVKQRADLGIAYDGDGDRLAAVDDQGQIVFGDQLLMLLARDALRLAPAKIVYEILCSQALADDVVQQGGTPIMTPSGYAFIDQAMRAHEAIMGGELSGHFFFNEPHFRFDDAMLATVKLMNVLGFHQQPLSTLVADLPRYHSSPELRLKCPDEAKAAIVERVRAQYRAKYQVEEIDGARIHFPGGWALVRQSNTQPVLSMRFEARSAGQLEHIQSQVQSLVESYIEEFPSR